MKLGKNVSLIVGISIPILMILFVSLSIYIPKLLADPEYDFLYVVNDDYRYKYDYRLDTVGHLVRVLDQRDPYYSESASEDNLYVYDVDDEESEPISFEDAAKLDLDQSSKSPDGYELVDGGGGGGFFPFYSGGSYGKKFLKADGARLEVNLVDDDGYGSNIKFLGWIDGR